MCDFLFGGGDDAAKAAEQAEVKRRQAEEREQLSSRLGINEVNRVFGNLVNRSDRPAITGEGGIGALLDLIGTGVPDSDAEAKAKQFTDLVGGDPSNLIEGFGHFTRINDREAAREALRESERRGQFSFADSPLLDELEKAFLDFATPEIQRQAEGAREKTTQQLARRGTLKSSIAAENFADIDRQRTEALSRAATKASEIRNQRISDLERSRNSIIAQLEATGNTSAAAQSAVNAVQAASATDNFEPLGQIFDVGLSVGEDVLKSQSQPFAPQTIFSQSGKGSQKVV